MSRLKPGHIQNDSLGSESIKDGGISLVDLGNDVVDRLIPDFSTGFFEADDFLGGLSAGSLGWSVSANGTGASAQSGSYGIDATQRAIGVLQIDTGTTATGRILLSRGATALRFGYCAFFQKWRCALETLSTATDRFRVIFGFAIQSAAGEPTNGCYFRYRDDLNAGRWQCVSRSGGVETVVDTTIAADTSYHEFSIDVVAVGNQIVFRIDGTEVATITTNIPTTLIGVGAKIEKSVGTAQRNFSIDAYSMRMKWSAPR